MKYRIKVSLNGTDKNPFEALGCTQNPFPQFGIHQIQEHELRLQKLGGPPIPDKQYIRDTLAGFSEEFVNLCVARYTPGEYVTFEVFWDDRR